jgi:flagellar hook-associated protein 1
MSGLASILETAKRALHSQRIGINVTSHNIANAATPGFSRQRAHLEPTPAIRSIAGLIGTGVTAAQVGRVRDQLIDQQIRLTNEGFGEASVKHRISSQIESVFNEPSAAGLSAALGRFFTSFQDLALQPEESSSRNAVLQEGMLLAQSFNRIHAGVSQLREDLLDDVYNKVRRINELTEQISAIDIEITNKVAIGLEPSDSKDKRDMLIDELSTLARITVAEDKRGSVLISIGGSAVASRAGSIPLKAEYDDGTIRIFNTTSGREVNIGGGELNGVLDMYNREIPDYIERFDALAEKVIEMVNDVHRTGYGIGNPPATGLDFFDGSGAGSIRVHDDIAGNVMNIAASADGAPGDNQIALALSDIPEAIAFTDTSLTISQFYNSLVSSVGSSVNTYDNTIRSREMVLNQLEHQKNGVSGVSLDEEMANLIRYQRAYEAAARVVTTVDSMFNTIINMV